MLATYEASYVNAATLMVDGGATVYMSTARPLAPTKSRWALA